MPHFENGMKIGSRWYKPFVNPIRNGDFTIFWHAITHILLDLGLSLDVLEARRVPAGLKFGLGPIGLCNITNISGSGSFGLEKSQNHRVRAPSGLKISPKARRAFGLGQARPITSIGPN